MSNRPKNPDPRPRPRLYLVTPPVADAEAFVAPLAAALTSADVAAVLLRLASADERSLINCAKALALVAQERDVALLLDGHVELVARSGADGAHLTGIDEFNDALATLKPERIAGCGGLTTRHNAMLAAEAGADYVMFGEPDAAGERPAFDDIVERVAWWAEVFQLPCVAYAAAPEEVAPLVQAGADFIALGDWLWRAPSDVAAQIATLAAALGEPETAA
jgi:thiamine-phosphate pyrophosphorylase